MCTFTVKMIDKEHMEAALLRKERLSDKNRKIVIAKKAFTVGMVSADSPSPIKRVAAGFCKGMADKTNEDGEAIFVATQGGFGTRNHCQAQLVSLAKHAWDGAVWEKIKRELMHELVTSGYTIKPP